MRSTTSRLSPKRCFGIVVCAVLLMAMNGHALPALQAESAESAESAQSAQTPAPVPDPPGDWNGTPGPHPTNGPPVPWARTGPEGPILPDGTQPAKNYWP